MSAFAMPDPGAAADTFTAAEAMARIKQFMADAGQLAVSMQQTALHSQKLDNTIVTEADIAVSKLFHTQFADVLARPGHVVVDEESLEAPLEEVLQADYQWIIDPIDGTASYACNSLCWGIILSVFRKGEPWVAAVYVPAIEQLLWADDTQAYETMHAFTDRETTRVLTSVHQEMHKSSQISAHYKYVAAYFDKFPCIPVDYWGPQQGTHVAAGRLTGQILHDCLWDFSAGWTMCLRVGAPFVRLYDGKTYTRLEADLLTPKFRLAAPMFMGSSSVYRQLTQFLKPLQKDPQHYAQITSV